MPATQHEPTEENIKRLCSTPGTHYFNVVTQAAHRVRTRVYSESKAAGTKVHTKYDASKEQLRVVITK